MKARFLFLYFLLFLAFGVLAFRLFSLTILRGAYFREVADGQRVRVNKIVASRGVFFDRKGRPLVRNIPVFKECDKETKKCRVISRDEALELEAQNKDVNLIVGVGREYPYREAMAHLLGYLGEATEDEVKSGKWALGDMVGRTGLEEQYEGLVKGQDGGELVEVDTFGVILRKIGKKEPISGQDVFLSLDLNLQKVAYEAMEGRPGAVVVTNPQTGEVLALVSSPSFDPNLLVSVGQSGGDKIAQIFNNPDKPMFNRALGGVYPPGSTFKIVTSTAGLEEGKITAETKVEDTGQIVIGSYRFANWLFTRNGGTEGQINVVRALARSTDTFFYKVGEYVGAEKLSSWSKRFGLGQTTEVDLPGEAVGFLPDPAKGEWFLGNTYHLAIGQGFLGLTPLQVNRMTQVVANGGKLCPLSLRVKERESERERECQEVGVKPETLKIVTEGLKQACSSGGTAGVFFNFAPQVACKTGTAEFNDPKGRTHAWFTAFAPLDPSAGRAEIVVTALVEAGGEGSSVAAPIAKKVMEEYFRDK